MVKSIIFSYLSRVSIGPPRWKPFGEILRLVCTTEQETQEERGWPRCLLDDQNGIPGLISRMNSFTAGEKYFFFRKRIPYSLSEK